jgi:hypothetical protein
MREWAESGERDWIQGSVRFECLPEWGDFHHN